MRRRLTDTTESVILFSFRGWVSKRGCMCGGRAKENSEALVVIPQAAAMGGGGEVDLI